MKNKINKLMNDTKPYNGTSIRRVLKLSLIFTVLITTAAITSANPLENINNSHNVESITSISNITDPHYFSLAKTAKIDISSPRVLDGSWSPDGSRLLVVSAFRPLGDTILTAAYVLNADGTEMGEIATTLNNTRSKSLDMGLGSWSPDGNRLVIPTNIFWLRDFFVIADQDGTLFRVVGKNFTTIDSIRENILNIEWQQDFTWSPEGTKAFVIMGFDPMKEQLFTADENGSILKQITNGSIENRVWNPIWSHDGKKIAFNGKNLWVINEDGTGLKKLAEDGENIYAGTISWSSDDCKIFYQINNSINSVNVDGTGTLEVVSSENRTMDDIFSLSPDGQMMLFTVSTFYNNGTINSKLYVAHSDGRNQKLLSDVTGRDIIKAAWSPKGDKISFIEDDNLYTINPDSSGRATIALTSFKYAWHPSGDYIAFSADVDKKTGKDVNHSRFWPKDDSYVSRVFIAKPDGTERVQITSNDSNNYNLGGLYGSWSPDGSRLLVESFDDLFVIKFSGYGEVMSLHAPSSVQQDEEFRIEVKSMSKPVENAVISLDSKGIGTTNETGQLNYSFKEPGMYLLNATKEGYRTASKLIAVKEQIRLSGQSNITATEVSTVATDAPKVPGFNVALSIIALIIIVILRGVRLK